MDLHWKTVRVFISSTFRDMQAERDWLVRFIFPRLREYLLLRHIHLVDVDLRWGVTSEQNATAVCREIIDECRPRFLCVLGGRYGWVPPGQDHSITAEEVHYGVLDRTLKERGFALFYFRADDATAAMLESNPGEFYEAQGSLNQVKLTELKRAIVSAGLDPFVYPAKWDGQSGRLTGLQAFGERVYQDLLASVEAEFGAQVSEIPGEFAEEKALMEAFMEASSQGYVLGSRSSVLASLLAHATGSTGSGYVCLTGSPGCGKSALLAHLSRQLALHADRSVLLISHFAGVSPGSTDVRRTLRRICHELKAGCQGIEGEIPNQLEDLIETFQDFLHQSAREHRVMIVLDALNQFDLETNQVGLRWLPVKLPEGARIVLSTLTGPVLESLRRGIPALREIPLEPLTAGDGEAIIDQYLQRYHKKFETGQRAALLAKADADLPLYLLAALEELRTLGTYEEITRHILELPASTRELFTWILKRLQDDDGFRDAAGKRIGQELVSGFAALLGASRFGLSQGELAGLLTGQGMDADPAGNSDPQGNVAALLQLLRPYLMRRGELIDFYHAEFRAAACQTWLGNDVQLKAAHSQLSAYFRRRVDPDGNATWTGDTPRSFSELPYHVYESDQHAAVFGLAEDPSFLAAQGRAIPDDPGLVLQTIQKAILAACRDDDAGRMARFLILHATHASKVALEAPLDALRAGSLKKAVQIAGSNYYPDEYRALWLLLLVNELSASDRLAAAREVLDMLQQSGCSLSFSSGELAIPLLVPIASLDQAAFRNLQMNLLNDREREKLCRALIAAGAFAPALEMAREREQPETRSQLLGAIAAAQFEAGDTTAGNSTLDEALQAASKIWGNLDKEKCIYAIGLALLQSKAYPPIKRILQSLTQPWEMERDGHKQIRLLAAIASNRGERVSTDSILAMAIVLQKMKMDFEAVPVFNIEAGNLEEAARFSAIAILQAGQGHPDLARKTLSIYKKKYEKKAAEFRLDRRAEVLCALTAAYSAMGDTRYTEKILEDALEAAAAVQGRGEADSYISRVVETATAVHLWELAGMAAGMIDNQDNRYLALSQIAVARCAASETQAGMQLLDRIDDIEIRVDTLCQLSLACARLKKPLESKACLQQAERQAGQLTHSWMKSSALRKIGMAAARLNDPSNAHRLYAASIQTDCQDLIQKRIAPASQTPQVSPPVSPAVEPTPPALPNLQELHQQLQEWKGRAKSCLDEAEFKIHNAASKLIHLGVALADAGDLKAAKDALGTARETAACIIENMEMQEKLLVNIAAAQAGIGDYEGAETTCSQLSWQTSRDQAWSRIALQHADDLDFELGLTTLDRVQSLDVRLAVGARIAVGLVKDGESAYAVRVLSKIPPTRTGEYLMVAMALAEAGDRFNFKRLLLPLGFQLDTARAACRAMQKLYPEAENSISEALQ